MTEDSVISDARRELAPTGTLRASINLGNPVLAQGTPEAPSGVTVDLARAVAERLGVPVSNACFDAARDSFAAVTDGRADLGFLAIEPARAEQVRFTAPYVLIEGVYVVPAASSSAEVTTAADLDAPGVRIGVKRGSAYDLYLTRTLEHAELVRGEEGVALFAEQRLTAGAGIRRPVEAWATTHPGHRVVEPRFMEIRQAVAIPRDRSDAALALVAEVVEAAKAGGAVADSLARAGQVASVAPPAA